MTHEADTYGIRASAGYWIQRLARSMGEHLREQFSEVGVPRLTWPILSAIHRGEASTPMEVARFVGLDPSAVTRKLDQLAS